MLFLRLFCVILNIEFDMLNLFVNFVEFKFKKMDDWVLMDLYLCLVFVIFLFDVCVLGGNGLNGCEIFVILLKWICFNFFCLLVLFLILFEFEF